MPVCVLPIASCQSEAFCLFQYILMNLSLDGIHRDESSFSEWFQDCTLWVSEAFEVRESHFLELLPNYSSLRKSLRQLVLLDRSLYSVGGLWKSQNKDPHYPTDGTGGREDVLTSWEHHLIHFLVKVTSLFNIFLQLKEKKKWLIFFLYINFLVIFQYFSP